MPTNKKSRDRIACLLRLMKENRYPNHTILEKEMRKFDMAGAYTISRKTVQRDVAWLKENYDAPIQYDPSQKGYYLANPYWEKYVPFLEEEEMDAAILGARLAETIFPPSRIRNEIRKGTDALWSRNNGSGDDFMLLAALVSNGSPAKINPEIFQTAFEAWRQHSRLQIRYCRVRDGHVSELLIEPHVLTLFDNVWYIRAKLLRSGEKRLENPEFLNFALARILGAILSEGHFEPDRKEIDRVNSGHLFDIPHIAEVKLKVSKQALRYAAEYMPVADCRQNPDGTCTLTLKDIEAYRVSHFILMSGGDAVILSPVELIRNTLDMAEKYIARQHETQNVSDEQV